MEDMNQVYRQHAQTVYKFLLAQCRNPDLAEELTFYQAVRSVDRFDGTCKVSVWLCQIAKHLWYQHLRKHRREVPLPEERPEAPGPSAEEGLLEREGQLAGLLAAAQAGGEVRGDVDPALLAALIMALVREVYRPAFFLDHSVSADAVGRVVTGVFLDGVLSAGPRD